MPGLDTRAVPPHSPALVRNRMPATLWAAYQAVWAFDDGLGTADLATLHELRFGVKWLRRYTLEFIREPLEPQVTGRIRPVVALQDHLGSQHDEHVAGELARAFAASTTLTATQVEASARFVEHLDRGVVRLGRTFGSRWRPITASRYRRSLGLVIARL